MTSSDTLRILLVEDDPGMAILARHRLEEVEGWTVATAHSATECRARLAAESFDLVLLDRGLPDCDGASLISETLALRSDSAIVMLTGSDSAASATESLHLGAWDYVVKQPNLEYLDELPGVIRRCAERLAWRREKTRLSEEVDLLSTAIRAAADAVIIVDYDGRVRFWNAAAEQLFGWPAEEVQGRPLPLLPSDLESEFADLAERARRGQPLVDVETTCRRRDGATVEVSLTLNAVCNPDGSVRAYVAVLRDISERKRLERTRADLAAMLTHDIKNPLTVIRGFASILAGAQLEPEYAECAAEIEQASEAIDALITDFLISATIDAGQLKMAREEVSVANLLQHCVQQFRAAASYHQLTLANDGHPGDVRVNGDRMQIERALGNLVGNAIKYTPSGGTVRVDAVTRNGTVVLRVHDTGPGINPEELPYVFDRYRRVRGARRIDGAGLGLYIVRSLIEAHGGSVSVTSEVGRGSIFSIALPAEGGDSTGGPSLEG